MRDPLIHVTSLEQAERMRVIRNTCREFMTTQRAEITFQQQIEWFNSIKDREDILPFLFEPRWMHHADTAFGYGLVRHEHGKWWLSGGLLPEFRGHGWGAQLFGELADYVHEALHETAWLTVWEHNERAIACYKTVGFTFHSMMVDAYSPPIMVMSMPPRGA